MADNALLLTAIAVALVAGTFVIARRNADRNIGDIQPEITLHRRALIQLGSALALLLGGLIYRIVSVSLIGARTVSDKRGQDVNGDTLSNARIASSSLSSRRGSILDRDGDVLVHSSERDDVWRRITDFGLAPHVLGYFSPLQFGVSGLEASRDGDLAGSDPLTFAEAIDSLLFRKNAAGHDLVTTLRADLQILAADLLSQVTGSAILIQIRTGEILAMASSPGFDSSALTTDGDSDQEDVSDAWAGITSQPNQPLLFRATTGLYPPGSTFKVLTAAAGIDSGAVTAETVFTDDGSLVIDGRVIPEFNRPDESQTEWTVREGLVWSLNVVYAQIGLETGAERYRQYAERFGIGTSPAFEFGVEPGQVAEDPFDLDNPNALADTAFGQGALLVTPLHMLRVMMAVANGGEIVRPALVREVRSADGNEIWTHRPEVDARPITSSTAATVLDMLVDSATYGYASRAAIPGLFVAGKTGTAESGQEAPHGWFIGAAGAGEPTHAVAVCLDYGGEGGGLPLQIGRALLDAAIAR